MKPKMNSGPEARKINQNTLEISGGPSWASMFPPKARKPNFRPAGNTPAGLFLIHDNNQKEV
jgi:hypothetical protein